MSNTTSLKLSDALEAQIAQLAALEGKTAHALMVDTLQEAMDHSLACQQLHADGEASYQETLSTNSVFGAADVKAYVLAGLQGGKPDRPQARPLDGAKPIDLRPSRAH
jgi:predicted transcriptional regulator